MNMLDIKVMFVYVIIADKTVKCDFQWDLSRGCILKTPFRSPFEWHVLSVSIIYE